MRLILVPLALLCAVAPAHASPLQACQTLPIGAPGDELYTVKDSLRSFIGSQTVAQMEWQPQAGFAVPRFLEQIEVYHDPSSAPWSFNGCQPGTQLLPLSAADKERIERAWVFETDQLAWGGLPTGWLAQPASDYTLASMEDVAQCKVMGPNIEWDPMFTWLAAWDDPSNPYHTNPSAKEALQRRGAAWLALQLIQLDWAAWDGNFPPVGLPPGGGRFHHPPQALAAGVPGDMSTSRELAGFLGHLAVAYKQVRDVIPLGQRADFETMIVVLAERLSVWGLGAIEMNLTLRGTWGLYEAWRATQDPDVLTWYQLRTDEVYDPQNGMYREAGYFLDDWGFDVGYNGWNLLHAVNLLSADPNASGLVVQAAHEMYDLRAHLLFRDPDALFYAPNGFSTRSAKPMLSLTANPDPSASSGGSLQGFLQAQKHHLPYASATLRNEDLIGTSVPGHPDPTQTPDDPFYRDLVCAMIGEAFWRNNAIQTEDPSNVGWGVTHRVDWPGVWSGRARSYGTPHFGVTEYDAGELRDWHLDVQDQYAQGGVPEEFPFEHDGPHLRAFSDEFVFAKQGDGDRADSVQDNTFAALVHAGPVSHYHAGLGQTPGGLVPAGLGGGQLSTFWSPWGGAFIRTLRKGYNNEFTPDTVDQPYEWRSWAMHAVSLLAYTPDPMGVFDDVHAPWTTSARILDPNPHITFYTKPVPRGDIRDLLAPEYACSERADTVDGDPDVDASAVRVHVCGEIPVLEPRWVGFNDPALSAPLAYERTFYINPLEVFVSTTITPGADHAGDIMAEAWETIPLYSQENPGPVNYGRATIWLHAPGYAAVDATWGSPPVRDVTVVTVARAEGVMRILFDTPQTVAVSDDEDFGAPGYVYGFNRNLMIDLLDGTGPNYLRAKTVTYRIEALPVGEDGGPVGDPGPASDQ